MASFERTTLHRRRDTRLVPLPSKDPALKLSSAIETDESVSARMRRSVTEIESRDYSAPGLGFRFDQISILAPQSQLVDSADWMADATHDEQANAIQVDAVADIAQPTSPDVHRVTASAPASASAAANATATSAPSGSSPAPQKPPAIPLPAESVIVDRAVQAIATKEVGGHVRQSGLKTAAGVSASYASITQTTTENALTLLMDKKSDELRAQAGLTRKQAMDANDVCIAVNALWGAVYAAAKAKTTADTFLADEAHKKLLTKANGLSEADVKTMFSEAALKAKIDEAHAAAKSKAPAKEGEDVPTEILDAQVDAIPEADRVGIDHGSLRSYIRTPINFGENRAAWQRKAVENMTNNGDVAIGKKIETVVESHNGMGLAVTDIQRVVHSAIIANPNATEEDVVKAAALHNNRHEEGYTDAVWNNYKAALPQAAPASAPVSPASSGTASQPASQPATAGPPPP